ncbi:MAG: 3-oxoacyl-[acyl-carrier-protein] synthase III C-terminal domain-containing protein [Caldilineaceae bacterium]
MQPLPLKIVGVGRYLPRRIVSSSEIEHLCQLPTGWVARNSGVLQRHWASDEESNSFMGAQAACEAIQDAGLRPTEIDLIINASGSSEQAIPDTGPLIQRQMGLGASGIPSITIHATCLSFVAALDTAASLIGSGRYRTILIVTSEIASPGVNPAQAESASLLGDAAAAVVVTRTGADESSALLAAHIETYGDGAHLTQVAGGGTKRHPNRPDCQPVENLFHMEGRAVAHFALRYSEAFLERLRPGLSTCLGEIKLVVPHQASLLMIRSLTRYGWPAEQIAVSLDRLGNCIAASIPCTLYETIRAGRIQRGEQILLVGTGAGLSLGGVILRY